MVKTRLIEPLVLNPAEFPPLPLKPGFAQLVADELGNAATPADGFDTVFSDLLAVMDTLDAVATALGADLVNAFTEADLIDPGPVAATAAGFTSSLVAPTAAVSALGTQLAGVKPAQPPKPTPGPGKPPGSPPGPCEAFVHFNPALRKPLTVHVPAIFGGGPLHITGRRFVGARAGAWREIDNFPAVVEEGVEYVMSVTQLVQLPAVAPGSFVVTTAEHGDITMFCMVLDAGANVPVNPPQGVGTEPAFPSA